MAESQDRSPKRDCLSFPRDTVVTEFPLYVSLNPSTLTLLVQECYSDEFPPHAHGHRSDSRNSLSPVPAPRGTVLHTSCRPSRTLLGTRPTVHTHFGTPLHPGVLKTFTSCGCRECSDPTSAPSTCSVPNGCRISSIRSSWRRFCFSLSISTSRLINILLMARSSPPTQTNIRTYGRKILSDTKPTR